jgi:oligopeptide/dipeptide ABC transporter ATP-binding protein
MYAGHIVETGTVDEVFERPSHPYTRGLLAAVPRLDRIRPAKLSVIEGAPPDLSSPVPGCPFQPRCPYRIPLCSEQNPGLAPPASEAAAGHEVACWVAQGVAS